VTVFKQFTALTLAALTYEADLGHLNLVIFKAALGTFSMRVIFHFPQLDDPFISAE
jgi:hypothetical protein